MIDTHCHLTDTRAFPDPAFALEAARGVGVDRVIVIGLDPEDWDGAIALAETFDNVYAAVGWHPNATSDYHPDSLGRLRDHLAHPKVVAMGEIGLDWYRDYASRDQQFRALHDQLDLAADLGKPVVFHARNAYADLIDVLEARPSHPYLFHCWAGDEEAAQRAVRLGAMFGVDGPVSYKNSDALRAVIRHLPVERIVLETDSPYLSPEPLRGKPNQPAHLPLINHALAVTLGIDEDECARLTTLNAERFFRL